MAKITNEMIYKTVEERVMAFDKFCKKCEVCRDCKALCGRNESRIFTSECMAYWLALEYEEEKPEPCFYCSHEIHVYKADGGGLAMICDNCGYCPADTGDFVHDVAAHNRIARAVR